MKRQNNVLAYNELKKDKYLKKEVFFVDSGFSLADYPVLIKKSNSSDEMIEKGIKQKKMRIISGHDSIGVTFIYGLEKDRLIVDKNNNPVAFLQDKVSSYAMSVNSFMPYAPEIQRYLNSFEEMPKELLYVLRLLKCMFDKNKKGFYKDDIEYFNNNIDMLNEDFFCHDGLFEKVFFGYTDRMIELLKKKEYSSIIDDYRRFEY